MKSFEPKELKTSELHAFLLSAVAPRPISFASTIDKEGNVNLSPFSFFNVYSSKPPIMVFSSNRSGKTGDIKDTYKNIKEVPEVVINIVTYEMVHTLAFNLTYLRSACMLFGLRSSVSVERPKLFHTNTWQ